jgi:hypothetical protein
VDKNQVETIINVAKKSNGRTNWERTNNQVKKEEEQGSLRNNIFFQERTQNPA